MAADELALTHENVEVPESEARAGTDWWAEARGILWLVLAVLGFHSFVAKPFFIPSESMLPGLLVGDRLVVTKYPYGYSFVTPTFHLLPFMPGRLFGRMPKRGDVVIVTPPGTTTDYIKRVIGLPGDRLAVRDGVVFLNGTPVPRRAMGERDLPVDANTRCDPIHYSGRLVRGANGRAWCRVPVFRETLPGGRSYDTIDLGWSPGDNYPEIRVPKDRVFLMGDNRDNSADSRYSIANNGLGGAVPWENIGGRAEFITFSLDGSATWNPLTWPASFRPGRAGKSLHPQKDGE
ncbi:signal peptidase I [Sphingomonas sp. M1-B02]|uniref:signal peptidase I n=1 Tax=Sphingomonas sp. M1-B02 TaxID=3114300 RepID=UPI00224037B4|nr:signal peptidase I [Sphingomonas sp. S6-11]UZK67960.1 signal peptidase I [Sphingomonas sp. S6-11]